MKEETTNVLVRFPPDLLHLVEEYRHQNRISSRHQAILEIIEKGVRPEKGESNGK